MTQKKKVTVKDIAARMGISLSTVNKALTGKPGISEKRRAEVIAVANEMGYVVNHVAQSLSRKPIRLGIIIPSLWQQYYFAVEEGMRLELEKLVHSNVAGEVRYVSDPDETRKAFEYFFDEGVDAIVYSPSLLMLDESLCEYINNSGLPVFLVGGDCEGIDNVSTVNINTEMSGHMAAELFSLCVPRDTAAAVFIGSKRMGVHAQKAEAFVRRASELGYTDVRVYETNEGTLSSIAMANELFSTAERVGAIYIATGTASPILEYVSRVEKDRRPVIVTTDIYDEIREGLKNGVITATVYQNQTLMGRLVIRTAYRYLVDRSSFGSEHNGISPRMYVTPQLFLPSNLDGFKDDDGSGFTIE